MAWNPNENVGNPTKSREVNDLIKTIKDLGEGNTGKKQRSAATKVLPTSTQLKRKSDTEIAEAQLKRAKSESGAPAKNPWTHPELTVAHGMIGGGNGASVIVPESKVNNLLLKMHLQRSQFLRSIDDQKEAFLNCLDRAKASFENQHAVMMNEIMNINNPSFQSAPAQMGGAIDDDVKLPPMDAFGQAEMRFSMYKGMVHPLPATWKFPNKFTVIDCMKWWFNGDAESNTPPLQFLKSGHLKDVKNGKNNLSKIRRVMKVIQTYGMSKGVWQDSWDTEKIILLWNTVWTDISPRIEGKAMQKKGADGTATWRSMYNAMAQAGFLKALNSKGQSIDPSEEIDEELEEAVELEETVEQHVEELVQEGV